MASIELYGSAMSNVNWKMESEMIPILYLACSLSIEQLQGPSCLVTELNRPNESCGVYLTLRMEHARAILGNPDIHYGDQTSSVPYIVYEYTTFKLRLYCSTENKQWLPFDSDFAYGGKLRYVKWLD